MSFFEAYVLIFEWEPQRLYVEHLWSSSSTFAAAFCSVSLLTSLIGGLLVLVRKRVNEAVYSLIAITFLKVHV